MIAYREKYAADEFETFCDVSISMGNKKIGRVMNVSLAPILTCANCSECLKLCYDIKANIQYGNVLKARARNTVLALEYMDRYFQGIRYALAKRRKNKYFRWHVGGDIPNYKYFCEMVEIAKEQPDFTFWTYTKNYGIVNLYVQKCGRAAIPENLTIMFSEWDGMKLVNPYNFLDVRRLYRKVRTSNRLRYVHLFSQKYIRPPSSPSRDNSIHPLLRLLRHIGVPSYPLQQLLCVT